jgi:integrase
VSRVAPVRRAFAQADGTKRPTLTASNRRHWTCSVRGIAKALDRPLNTLPGRWTALRQAVDKLHHAPLGLTAKTLANHKANLRAALRWLSGTTGLPSRGVPLTPDWAALRDGITDKGLRQRLYGLMRFASAQGLAPGAVDDHLLAAYLRYRAETTALAADTKAHRSIARSWNRCAEAVQGWPGQRLQEPALPTRASGPPWESYPERLRGDLEAYLASLARPRRSRSDKRLPPARASTILTRRRELGAFIGKAVEIGMPLERLTSLSALLDPNVVRRVLDAYWKSNGDTPKTYTIDLAWELHAIAQTTRALPPEALAELDDLRAVLEEHRQGGLTDKNLALIRQVLSGDNWREVVRLPEALVAKAKAMQDHAPVKAALRAQLAIAIALLTVAPVRLKNLVEIRLEDNLIRPAGPDEPYWLVFPDYDVKNRVKLEFPLDEHVTALIETYVHEHRPVLLRDSNDAWLFPGEAGGHKTPSMFSEQITGAVLKATGLRLTVHQFRHAAAALILRQDPGNYEWVRRVLGHKNIQTTIKFYIGLETTQANELFGRIVRETATFGASPEDACRGDRSRSRGGRRGTGALGSAPASRACGSPEADGRRTCAGSHKPTSPAATAISSIILTGMGS